MKKNFINNLAQDLLRLEVNTIVKDQLLASQPRSHRFELFDIAKAYRGLLTSYSVMSFPPHFDKENAVRKEFKNLYGGLASFLEIQEFAEYKKAQFEEILLVGEKNFSQQVSNDLKEGIIFCERIIHQSQQIVAIFLDLQQKYSNADNNTGESDENRLIRSDNEFPQMRLDYLEDLDLTPDQIGTIRKINEIGVQRILLQTVVQVKGDITSYLTTRFLHFPHKEQQVIKEVHESSILTSIRMWQYLFQAVSKLAGNLFTGITGRQLNTQDETKPSLNKPKRIG